MKKDMPTPMDFRTRITPVAVDAFVRAGSSIMCIGSCFADNIGAKLIGSGFNCTVNPFGVLYNPASIGNVIERSLTGDLLEHDDLWTDGVQWFSYLTHGQFNANDADRCLVGINRVIVQMSDRLLETDVLVITLGTSYVYRLHETGEIVANCHKQAQDLFTRELLDHDEALESIAGHLLVLLKQRPDLQIILTVSPVRHLRDKPHENQLSKAHLLILAESLSALSANIHYFPAYEIMMDDLRDYRFYADDMVHPSSVAIDYIWTAVMSWCFNSEAIDFVRKVEEIRQRIRHRSRNPNSVQHRQFLETTERMVQELIKEFPDNPITECFC